MKKNRMMRLASGLLVAVLATTSMISGTYAKYTTQDSAKDSARVAKWGVELQVGGDLYGEDYVEVADGNIVGTSDLTVSFDGDGTNLVAPGTQSETGFDFSLTGVPEVSGTVTTTIEYENIYLNAGKYGVAIKADGVTADNFATWGGLYLFNGSTYVVQNDFLDANKDNYYTIEDLTEVFNIYYPVEYQMTGDGLKYNDSYNASLETDTLKEIVNTIGPVDATTTYTEGKTKVTWTEAFTPNTNLADTINLDKQQISWKWDFCNDPDTTHVGDDVADEFCGADTILGNLQAGLKVVKETTTAGTFTTPVAANGTDATELYDYNLETSFHIDIVVTQVD